MFEWKFFCCCWRNFCWSRKCYIWEIWLLKIVFLVIDWFNESIVMGRNRRLKVFLLDELKIKGIRELFGYLGKLYKCEVFYDKLDMDSNFDLLNDGYIYFKEMV